MIGKTHSRPASTTIIYCVFGIARCPDPMFHEKGRQREANHERKQHDQRYSVRDDAAAQFRGICR
jgi:hypothetical protein